MPRAIWKGAINFGLIHIPVAAYGAVKEDKIALNMFRESDLSPIRQKRVAEADGVEVPAAEIVKGYKDGDQVIVITDEDLDSIALESTKVIEIEEFIKSSEIDHKFFEKPYVLEPDKTAQRPYSLLFKALQGSDKVGIGKVSIRNREYLVAIKANGSHLLMIQLRFANEILNASDINGATDLVNAAELKMAKQLIDQMTSQTFDASRYENAYIEALRQLIEDKRSKKVIKKKILKSTSTQIPDMLQILQASMDQAAKKGKKKAA